ncbi:ankyrin repeat domain-containing protein [Bacillus carboniphilus]|uniref:Ankyrin repeat domain-containing protein n=1 Tax=Bacillus carboniphilus TaxID=86663 RepID=A0ABY9JU37_9BACI|nr:ankyrin repeat domain-containing protein [Bacillus carboniphilus]WLR42895.1 ankyrin repeat domain-containing protein [Bacillus carboniphilus]
MKFEVPAGKIVLGLFLTTVLYVGLIVGFIFSSEMFNDFFDETTQLEDAFYDDDFEKTKDLLMEGEDPSKILFYGQTIIHKAIAKDKKNYYNEYMEYIEDPNIVNDSDESLLTYACMHASIDIIEDLVNRGANINYSDDWGYTPLLNAIASEREVEIIQFLLENGANPNFTQEDGLTALQLAEENGYDDIVEAIKSHMDQE